MKMKKLLALGATASTLIVMAPAVQAAGSNTFTVSANLTSRCTVAAFAGSVDFGIYTALTGPATAAPTATSAIECTRGITVTGIFDDNAGDQRDTAGQSATPAGAGVLSNGLYYTIAGAFASTQTGIAPTAAGGVNAADSDKYTFTVTGTMPASQAGTDGVGAASHTRTLTLNF